MRELGKFIWVLLLVGCTGGNAVSNLEPTPTGEERPVAKDGSGADDSQGSEDGASDVGIAEDASVELSDIQPLADADGQGAENDPDDAEIGSDTGTEVEDGQTEGSDTALDSGTDSDSGVEIEPDSSTAISWNDIQSFIDSKPALQNSTVMIGNGDDILFSYSRGESTEDSSYVIASASKLLTAITLLRIVDSGDLALDTKSADILPFWTQDAEDPRSAVTLQQLLSFTSGFSGSSGVAGDSEALPCVEDGGVSTSECTQEIYEQLFSFPPAGSTFYYGPSHMYVAALMAMTVRESLTWNKVFRQEIGDMLDLDVTSGFLIPSPKNGRPGGGAVMSPRDYASILRALVAGELLTPESMEALTQDNTPSATVAMEYVPETGTEYGTWHYALGCWRECFGADYDASNCDAPGVVSSPGAFGFYPWWDQVTGQWGVIAVQFNIPGAAKITSAIGAEIRSLMKSPGITE